MVAAPAHHMPIDFFSGPMRVMGTMNGQAVAGFGFHERTLPLSLPRQLVIVLRDLVLHLPATAVRERLALQQLADLVWEMMRFLRDRRYLAARSYIDETVRPALSPIADSHRPHLLQIADDLASRMSPFA